MEIILGLHGMDFVRINQWQIQNFPEGGKWRKFGREEVEGAHPKFVNVDPPL